MNQAALQYQDIIVNQALCSVGSSADQAIESFFKFLNFHQIDPAKLSPLEARMVLQKGHIVGWFKEELWNHAVFHGVCQDFLASGIHASPTFSVLSALAFFLAAGVRLSGFNDVLNDASHDFKIGWSRRVMHVKTIHMNPSLNFDMPVLPTSVNDALIAPRLLVALDVGELSDPFPLVEEMLQELLPHWAHVSAVLVFSEYYKRDNLGWTCQFFNNAATSLPIDHFNLQYLNRFEQRMVVAKSLAI